jgi:hypothetical protein
MEKRALTYDEIRAFETALRKAIERSDLAEAEALIRTELARAPDVLLQEVIDRPLEELRIRDWDNIAADMEAVRRRVPEAELEREWGAVLLGLINRNNVAGLPLSVAFTFDAEPRDAQALFRPSYMTDAQFEAWQADFQDRIFLPKGARYKAYPSAGAPHLAGIEELRGVHDRRAVDLPSDRRDAIYTAHSLAAAIVLLRFHQLVERYLDHPGLPRPLPVFVHVETAAPAKKMWSRGGCPPSEVSSGRNRCAPGSSDSRTRRKRSEAIGQLLETSSGNGFFAVASNCAGNARSRSG